MEMRMFSAKRCSLFAAIFAGCAFSVFAESVAVKPAKKESKVVKCVKTEISRKTKEKEKSESEPKKTDLNAESAKSGEVSTKSVKKAPAKTKLRDFESEADHRFRKDLVLRVNELILKTQKEAPAISAEFTEDRKLDLLKVFTAALGDGVEYVPALDYKPLKPSAAYKKNKPYHKSIIIATGKVLYLRIDLFNKKTLKGLRSDCASIAELEEKPLGLVLDLRSAMGCDYEVVSKAVDLFIKNGKKEKVSKSASSAFFDIPIILLVDVKTNGAAEVFAAAIVKAGRGICLGEPTAGVPFKKRKIMLANGDYLLIPLLPKKFAKFASTSLKPDIHFTAKPQISYKRLKSGGDAESSDKCVARAVELLICLNAISTSQK